MVDRVGSGGLGRAAIEAALKQMRERAAAAGAQPAAGVDGTQGPDFTRALEQGLAAVDTNVKAAEELPLRVVQGELDFHEVYAQLKESELSFEFAMQVRNKLIDAYREVMRMNV